MSMQLATGGLLILATTVVHSAVTFAVMRLLRLSARHGWARGAQTARALLLGTVILLLCYAALVEAALWAGVYVAVGAVAGFEPALYFSIVTFTTLGYGDVVLDPGWRLLGALQSANGIILFGWTTALVVALLQHLTEHDSQD